MKLVDALRTLCTEADPATTRRPSSMAVAEALRVTREFIDHVEGVELDPVEPAPIPT